MSTTTEKTQSKTDQLRISEIFYSLQGEANAVGLPTTFVRLTGCPLRCGYCDSEYAFYGGQKQSLDAIVSACENNVTKRVCVTGGEPLAQPLCHTLIKILCDKGFEVSLETSGALSIKDVDARTSIVMDLKTPSSGEVDKNLYENIQYLRPHHQVKFIIANQNDFDWACLKIDELKLREKTRNILFSPSFEELKPETLAEWILRDRLDVRFQIQLHKYLWGDKPGV